MRGAWLAVAALLVAAPRAATAQWAVEGMLGNSWSARSPLTIRQDGFPDIRIDARYKTRPFNVAPYYSVRVSYSFGRWGVHAEDLHHKLYLQNTTPEVTKFEVTYGYNLIGAGPTYRWGDWMLVGSVGPVVTNPSSTVRGRSRSHGGGIFGLGYFIDGVHASAGINRRLHLSKALFVTLEGKVSAGWARVDVVDGNADVPNYALHLLAGIGIGNRRHP